MNFVKGFLKKSWNFMKIFLSDRKSILQHNLRQKRLFATCRSKPLYIDVGFYRSKAAKPPYITSSSTRRRRISRRRKPSISRAKGAYHGGSAAHITKPQGFPYHEAARLPYHVPKVHKKTASPDPIALRPRGRRIMYKSE